jgi:2',3'-cyclic-nucleotide 2'-phosphodiesterase (5'-nucleotidase family)
MKTQLRVLSVLLALLLVPAMAWATGVRETTVDYELQLLHFADIDGQPEALDNVGAFSALVNEFRAEHPNNTLMVSSGDNYIPGPRFFASGDEAMNDLLGIAAEGRADITFLNEMGVVASALGNHDLDSGPEGFMAAIAPESNDSGSYPGAHFPFVAANVDFTTDANTAPYATGGGQVADAIPGQLAPSAMAVVGGEVIGIVGATTPRLDSITSTGDLTISPDSDSLQELAAAIQPAIDDLTQRGVDKIVLLSHMQQIAIEQELAGLLHDVDIIVGGGSNAIFADRNDRLWPGDEPQETYPMELTSASGDPVLLVNVDGDYRYLGRLTVGFDSNGVILPETLDSGVNGAYATHMDAMPAVDAQPNERISSIVEGLREVLQRREGNILGFTNVYLDGRRSQVRTQATNLGNLTSDANLWYARQYDASAAISLKNGGGIRAAIGDTYVPAGSVDYTPEFGPPPAIPAVDKPEGGISQFDIEGSLRFNNSLTILTVTAAELRDILEHGVAATEEGATPGQFPQVAGMRFSFDPSRASGDRVREAVVVNESGEVTDEVVMGGEIQGDSNRTFRLVTLGFLADGGDGYPFDSLSNPNRVNLDAVELDNDPGTADFAPLGTEQDALAEYLLVRHGNAGEAFDTEETPAADDLRIQNLSVRSSSLR